MLRTFIGEHFNDDWGQLEAGAVEAVNLRYLSGILLEVELIDLKEASWLPCQPRRSRQPGKKFERLEPLLLLGGGPVPNIELSLKTQLWEWRRALIPVGASHVSVFGPELARATRVLHNVQVTKRRQRARSIGPNDLVAVDAARQVSCGLRQWSDRAKLIKASHPWKGSPQRARSIV